MKCELRVVTGARAGHHDVYDKSYIGIGRHPLSDLRFDAEKDIDASTRHAAIVKTGDTYVLRDLESTNGTFVNGERITGERVLKEGDVLRFGVHGPEVSFHLMHESHDEVVMPAVTAPMRESIAREASERAAKAAAEAPRAPKPPAAPPPAPKPAPKAPPPSAPRPAPAKPVAESATGVLRAEIRDHRGRSRALLVALLIVMLGAFGIILWQGRTAQEDRASTRMVIDSMRGELARLRVIQRQNESALADARTRLGAERDPSRRALLRREVQAAEVRGTQIAASTAVNWNAALVNARRAVAMVIVRFPDGQVFSGTGFGVDADGRMLTNRHIVLNDAGQRATDIAIRFTGSTEVLPARIERIAPDVDLAVIRIESAGPHPVVPGFSDAEPADGDPIALVGFPLGGDLPQGQAPTASSFFGAVSRVLPDSLLQLDAWSGSGASGSPIFDRHGRVTGVEFGGVRESGGRIVLGLPIRRALALLGR